MRKMVIITFGKWHGGREDCPGTDGRELKNKGHDRSSSSFEFSCTLQAHLLICYVNKHSSEVLLLHLTLVDLTYSRLKNTKSEMFFLILRVASYS